MNDARTLEDYLALNYSLEVIAQPEGGYVLQYPDLPGCMTQVDSLQEIGDAAEEIRSLWIETQLEDGVAIPLPSFDEDYSGKFVLRIEKSLHRRLARSAKRDGVSLNQYAGTLLDRNDAVAQVEVQLESLQDQVREISRQLRHQTLSARPRTRARTLRARV